MIQRIWPNNWKINPNMRLTPKKLILYAGIVGIEILLISVLFTVINRYYGSLSNDYLRSIVATLIIDSLLVLNTFIVYGFYATFFDLFQSKHLWYDILMGLLWGLIIFFVMTFCGLILLLIYNHFNVNVAPQQITQAMTGLQGTHSMMLALLMVVAAPLGEEFFFRAVLHRTLIKYIAVFPALCVSSFGFALFHGDWFQFPQLWLGGILLAISYHKTQSLTTSIVAHAVINAIPLGLALVL